MPIHENRAEVYIPLEDHTGVPGQLIKPIDNPVCNAAVVVINVSQLAGGVTVTFNIEGIDALGNTYLILASAAIASVSVVVLRVGPELTAATNLVAKDYLPRRWRIRPVHSDSTVVATYSVCYNANLR